MSMAHMDGFDLTQVKLLAELSGTRSVSQAARRVGVSQSAASHALARLREQLGDPLFTRVRDGFQPTPFGARLGQAAREALDTLAAGLNSKDQFDPTTTSRIFTFLTNDVGQAVLLPRLLKFLKKAAPAATVRILPIPMHDPGATLSSGEVDFAAGFFDNLNAGFRQTVVLHERYVCIVRSGHRLFRGGMNLKAFRETEHAIADSTGMAHAILDRFLARHSIRRKIALRVPALLVLPMIVADSDLLAVVPGRLAEAFQSRLPIKVMPPPVPIPSYDIRIHWHERYDRDPAIQWMRRAFVGLFANDR
jgi:DNA-binding transcriptional LysR family regulator